MIEDNFQLLEKADGHLILSFSMPFGLLTHERRNSKTSAPKS